MYIIGLFMRPINSQSLCPIIIIGRAGSYRAWVVIWAILIGLLVIGLPGALVISRLKVINNNLIFSDRIQKDGIRIDTCSYYQKGTWRPQIINNNHLDGIQYP